MLLSGIRLLVLMLLVCVVLSEALGVFCATALSELMVLLCTGTDVLWTPLMAALVLLSCALRSELVPLGRLSRRTERSFEACPLVVLASVW